jgi:RNA polymerase sigma-70 factor (ECF subfamily)
LELRFFEERPFSEVADILGITENNAKVKTYRVIDKLRIIFKKVS